MTRTLQVAAATALIALAGCGDVFEREAGDFLDEGRFGNPTMNNTMIHSGEINYAESLGRRFAESVPTTINFAFDSARLEPEAQAILRRQADFIRQFPEVRFTVYGHTDLVGSDAYNRQLGQRRANAAVAYLVSQGISRSRLDAVVSLGESRPVVVTPGRERRNRRTVTEVTGFVQSHPSVLNGKYAQIIFRDYVASAVEPTTRSGVDQQELGGG